jgi:fructose-bisphosphate aldolase class 1
MGKEENMNNAQAAFSHRALMNKNAALGKWNKDLEN